MKEVIIDGNKYELTDEEFDFLMCEQPKGKELKVVDAKDKYDNPIKKVVAVERVITEEEKFKARINELKSLLMKTDYQAIKFAEGELSAEEYLPIKQKRRSYRAEINSLEEKLKNFA